MKDKEIVNKAFDYHLNHPFEYHYKGGVEMANFITLHAPTSKNHECADLKQIFYNSLPDNDKVEVSDGDSSKKEIEELDGEAIMMLISMSKNVKLKQVLIYAKELFSSDLAFVDGETKLTKNMIDNMSLDDLENMIGEYYLNFILASWLQKMKDKL